MSELIDRIAAMVRAANALGIGHTDEVQTMRDAITAIQQCESKLEEARAFQNEWHNPADLLQINQLQSRLDETLRALDDIIEIGNRFPHDDMTVPEMTTIALGAIQNPLVERQSPEMWKLYRVGDYWQCATPIGPYNFQAFNQEDAQRVVDEQRRRYESE